MTSIPTLTTPHLTLRPLEPGDAQVLYRINQVEGVLQYFPYPAPPPLEKVQRFVAGQQVHWEQHGYGNWGILPEGEKEIIGWAGLQFLPETGETEVGYLLNRPFWGRGYATEAARASLQFGFDHFDLQAIIALVFAGNIASRRVIEKCGLTLLDRQNYFGVELMRHRIEKPAFEKLRTTF